MLSHFSCVWLFRTLYTIGCKVPLSMGFSRQEHWSRLLGPPQGIFLTQESNLSLLRLLYWLAVFYSSTTQETPYASSTNPCSPQPFTQGLRFVSVLWVRDSLGILSALLAPLFPKWLLLCSECFWTWLPLNPLLLSSMDCLVSSTFQPFTVNSSTSSLLSFSPGWLEADVDQPNLCSWFFTPSPGRVTLNSDMRLHQGGPSDHGARLRAQPDAHPDPDITKPLKST